MREMSIGAIAVGAMTVIAVGCGFDPATSTAVDADPSAPDGDPTLPVDAMPGVDTDGDGREDALDNCASIPNPAQYNEDGDDRGDVCDACPHRAGSLAQGSDVDSDGDTIGDQCDPTAGGADVLVVFLPFNEVGDLSAFGTRSGANQWQIGGGKLSQIATEPSTAQHVVWETTSIAGTVAVETRAHVDAVLGGTHERLVAVTGAYYDGSPVDTYACGLNAQPNAATQIAAVHYSSPPTVNEIARSAASGTMVAGAQAHLVLSAFDENPNSRLGCLADSSPATINVSGYYPEGYPGFRTVGVQASFDYLWVVDVAP
jgi:hypothetical protein